MTLPELTDKNVASVMIGVAVFLFILFIIMLCRSRRTVTYYQDYQGINGFGDSNEAPDVPSGFLSDESVSVSPDVIKNMTTQERITLEPTSEFRELDEEFLDHFEIKGSETESENVSDMFTKKQPKEQPREFRNKSAKRVFGSAEAVKKVKKMAKKVSKKVSKVSKEVSKKVSKGVSKKVSKEVSKELPPPELSETDFDLETEDSEEVSRMLNNKDVKLDSTYSDESVDMNDSEEVDEEDVVSETEMAVSLVRPVKGAKKLPKLQKVHKAPKVKTITSEQFVDFLNGNDDEEDTVPGFGDDDSEDESENSDTLSVSMRDTFNPDTTFEL